MARLPVYEELSFFNQLRESVVGQLAIPENFVKKSRADDLARVHWYNRASAILVAQKMVAALDANNRKPGPSEGGNKIGAGDAGAPAHAATVTR